MLRVAYGTLQVWATFFQIRIDCISAYPIFTSEHSSHTLRRQLHYAGLFFYGCTCCEKSYRMTFWGVPIARISQPR